MKKVIFSLMAVFALIFVSCSNDDDNNENANDSGALEGTWKLTSWSAEEAIDLNNDGTASVNLLDEMNCYTNENIVFSSTNVVTYISTSYANITFELESGSTTEYDYTVSCIAENESSQATYTRNGSTITISTDPDDPEEVTIATVSGNTLSFVIPEGYEAVSGSSTAAVTQDLTLTYTKQ